MARQHKTLDDRLKMWSDEMGGVAPISDDRYFTLYKNLQCIMRENNQDQAMTFLAMSDHTFIKWNRRQAGYKNFLGKGYKGRKKQLLSATIKPYLKAVELLTALVSAKAVPKKTTDQFLTTQIRHDLKAARMDRGALGGQSPSERDIRFALHELYDTLHFIEESLTPLGRAENIYENGLALDLCRNYLEVFSLKAVRGKELKTLASIVGEYVAALNKKTNATDDYSVLSLSFKKARTALKF